MSVFLEYPVYMYVNESPDCKIGKNVTSKITYISELQVGYLVIFLEHLCKVK